MQITKKLTERKLTKAQKNLLDRIDKFKESEIKNFNILQEMVDLRIKYYNKKRHKEFVKQMDPLFCEYPATALNLLVKAKNIDKDTKELAANKIIEKDGTYTFSLFSLGILNKNKELQKAAINKLKQTPELLLNLMPKYGNSILRNLTKEERDDLFKLIDKKILQKKWEKYNPAYFIVYEVLRKVAALNSNERRIFLLYLISDQNNIEYVAKLLIYSKARIPSDMVDLAIAYLYSGEENQYKYTPRVLEHHANQLKKKYKRVQEIENYRNLGFKEKYIIEKVFQRDFKTLLEEYKKTKAPMV